MIETRESYQPLLKNRNSPPQSPGRRRKKHAEAASYGTLKGEALLHADDSTPTNHGPSAFENNSTPQSVESSQYAEYQKPLATIPMMQQSNGIISPLSSGALPPAIPRRSRADSSGDRSAGELSTVSGVSGHNRIQRSSSEGHEVLMAGAGSLSPTYYASGGGGGGASYGAIPPRSSRRSRSPKPPRRSSSPTTHNNANLAAIGGSVSGQPGHPLHRRRPSDEFANRHRRTHSCDVPREQLRRGDSSASLYSLNSGGSMNSETLKMLPDPRWGGGSGSVDRDRARSSSYSGNIGSYSTDSDQFGKGAGYYGSVGSSKEVIMNGSVNGNHGEYPLQARHHRRNNSEISTSTYASVASIDKSVEPVMTNMTKSAMFKGVTNDGVVKLQLPKDNFRLLSDRDLESGRVYKRALVDNEDDYFQDYHITIDDTAESAFSPTSANCGNCNRKQLPPSYYVMAVDSDIYRRMFDEVSESINMPCGLFYCGHHEDVDYPSIGIAVIGVVFIFAVMLWATIFVDG